MKKLLLTVLATFSLTAFGQEVATINTPAPIVDAAGTKTIILTEDNSVSLRDEFNEDTVSEVMSKLQKLDSTLPSNYPIYLVLYTPGGSVQAGLELFEYIKGVHRPVHTVTVFAASMGFQTVQQLGTRYIVKSGVLMSHQAAGGVRGEFSRIKTRFDLWVRRVEELDRDAAARTNGKYTYEQSTAAYQNELWLTGTEAVTKGFADEVVNVRCDAALSKATEEVTVRTMFGSFTLELSKCAIDNGVKSIKKNILTNLGLMELTEFTKQNPSFATCADIMQRNRYLNKGQTPEAVVCAVDPSVNYQKFDADMKKAEETLLLAPQHKVRYYE